MRTPTAAVLVLFLAAAPALASTLSEARVGLHFGPVQKGFPCDVPGLLQGYACDYPHGSNLDLEGDLNTGYSLYVVVLDIDPEVGLSGVSLGIAYDEGDLFVLPGDLCSDLEFPSATWPASGSGAVFTWSPTLNCQASVDPTDPQGQAVAVPYAFYAYAYANASAAVIERPEEGALKLADCASAESRLQLPDQGGVVRFGTPGIDFPFDPCTPYPLPVEEMSWGRLKRMYGPDRD